MGDFYTQLLVTSDPSDLPEFEFIRLVNDMPLGAFYKPEGPQPGEGACSTRCSGTICATNSDLELAGR